MHPTRLYCRLLRLPPETLASLVRTVTTDPEKVFREYPLPADRAAYLIRALGSDSLARLIEDYDR